VTVKPDHRLAAKEKQVGGEQVADRPTAALPVARRVLAALHYARKATVDVNETLPAYQMAHDRNVVLLLRE